MYILVGHVRESEYTYEYKSVFCYQNGCPVIHETPEEAKMFKDDFVTGSHLEKQVSAGQKYVIPYKVMSIEEYLQEASFSKLTGKGCHFSGASILDDILHKRIKTGDCSPSKEHGLFYAPFIPLVPGACKEQRVTTLFMVAHRHIIRYYVLWCKTVSKICTLW